MKDNFEIKIESYHIADRGNSENVHQLPPEKLKCREVVHIDIAKVKNYIYMIKRHKNQLILVHFLSKKTQKYTTWKVAFADGKLVGNSNANNR